MTACLAVLVGVPGALAQMASKAVPAAPVPAASEPDVPPSEGEPAPGEVLEPAGTKVVEIVPRNAEHWDATVFSRPDAMSPIAGHVARGARVPVLGKATLPRARYCKSNTFYALAPLGFVCADDAEPSAETPSTDRVLQLREDSTLPYDYAMVRVEEGEEVPMWASLSDIADYAPPKRMLGRGDTIAIEDKTVDVEGQRYYVSIDGDVVPAEQTHRMRKFSAWQGVTLEADTHLPFGWITAHKARVYDGPRGKKIGQLERRTRVDILGEETIGRRRWLAIGDGQYLRGRDVNEVRAIARPEGTGTQPQWLDVDLGEQVVVAYRGERPVYATLISSGRPPHTTPRGNYPIWGKVSAITMKSQPYDDKPYYVHRVPWVLFFQAHNALHGAYWHDKFGRKKSHGCANLSPKDARYLFEWVEPKLPPGWTAVRFNEEHPPPIVHVRHSGYRHPFRQERPQGPPDPELEAKKAEAAEARRAKELEELLQLQQAAEADQVPPMLRRAPEQTATPALPPVTPLLAPPQPKQSEATPASPTQQPAAPLTH
ncbi:MAG: L,D-transpeptidase [Myxococcales bacterium]|nr:L,D-transpeptidase [Myxococcales bacterium]